MSDTPRTLVIVATYNERENLPRLVEEVFQHAPQVELLVIDDDSPDGTGDWCDEFARHEPRFHCLHRAGKLGLGTAVLAGLAAAITRQGPDGQPFGGWQAQERLTREEALAAYTMNGAYAGFAEGRFGRLVRGERADFLLVDQDPLLATPSDLRATKVRQVWINGRLAWDAAAVKP